MSNILRYGRAAGNPRRRGDGAALARFFSLSHFVAWEPRIWPSRAPEKPNALLETGSRRAFSPGGQRGTRTPDLYDVSVVQELFPVFALSTKPVVMAILAIHLSVVSTLWPSNSVQLAAVWPQ